MAAADEQNDSAQAGEDEAAPFKELSPEEVAKLSKDDRGAYHKARIAAQKAKGEQKTMTKAERKEVQEAQRKKIEDKKKALDKAKEAAEEVKLMGLSEDAAKALIESMANDELVELDDDDDDECDTLLGSVRKFMRELKVLDGEEAQREFNMQVRFQGHVDTTPPDHVKAICRVLVEEACSDCDFAAPKLPPPAVQKLLEPGLTKWSPLLKILCGKVDDPLLGADVIVQAVQEGVSAKAPEEQSDGVATNVGCAVVGCIMAVRDAELIDDDDLLTGCKRSENKSVVMERFIEHLEEELEDDDGDADDGD